MKNTEADSKGKIIVICGPTAIGKTGAAIGLAQKFQGEIVSADSMQIYQYMDIGTAKPTAEEKAAVKHHMIDIAAPDEEFDAARYAEEARGIISELHHRGIPPFVVGGTGLYLKTLLHGIFQAPPSPPALREELRRIAEESGSPFLHRRLLNCDPESARKIHPNDSYRIIRALEIYESTGKSIREYQKKHLFAEKKYRTFKIALHSEREILYERINRRVDAMLDAGLEDEVRELTEKGYSHELKSMQSIGYRHMNEYIRGLMDYTEAVRTMKRDTRRYAKRQFTWFRADPEMIWVKAENLKNLSPDIKKFLQE